MLCRKRHIRRRPCCLAWSLLVKHRHIWGTWLGRGKKRHRYCVNGWCSKGQDSDRRVYVARPDRTGATALQIKKKKKKKVKRKPEKKRFKRRTYTRKIAIVSSGCKHKNSGHDRFGPEECDDCGAVMQRVWLPRNSPEFDR